MKTRFTPLLLGLVACGPGAANVAPFPPVAVGAAASIQVVDSDLDCGLDDRTIVDCERKGARIESIVIEPEGVFELVGIDGATARVRALASGRSTARISASLDGSALEAEVSIEARVAEQIRPVAYGGFELRAFVMDPGSTVRIDALVLDANGERLTSDELEPFSDPTGALTIARSPDRYSRSFDVTASGVPVDTHLASTTGHGVDVRIASGVVPTAVEMWVPDALGTPLAARAVGIAGDHAVFFGDLRVHFESLTPEICGPVAEDANTLYTIAATLEVPINAPGTCEIHVRTEGIEPTLEATGSGIVAPAIQRIEVTR